MKLLLDLQMFNGEKTESATPKKRAEARSKGQVARSQELPGSFIMLLILLSFIALGGYMKDGLTRMFGLIFEQKLLMELNSENLLSLFYDLLVQLLLLLAPIFAIAVIIAILGNFVQFGFLITGENLKLNFTRLNPIQGFKNIFSMRSLVEFVKNILKLIIIGYIVYSTLWGARSDILKLSHVSVGNLFSFTASLTLKLGITISAVLVVMAIVDFVYQKYEYEKSLKMSLQDIKDEYKKTEGDPLIKGKIRERQRRMAMQRMMQEVPNADVIITNPTHFAVAIKYDSQKMQAPVVVAKGTDYVAMRIREVATENRIMLMENKPLARALYARTEIGDTIPPDLFQAVAEILAYVYRIKGTVK